MTKPSPSQFPPGPRSRIPAKDVLDFRRDTLGSLIRIQRKYGNFAHFSAGNRHYYLVNEPDLIKDVLVTNSRKFVRGIVLQRSRRVLGNGLLTSEGRFHLRQRRLMQPAFHRHRISGYGSIMVEHASRVGERWRDGEILNIHIEMMHLALSIVGQTLFDTDIAAEAKEISTGLNTFMEMVPFIFLPFSKFLERLPIPPMLRLSRAIENMDRVVYKMIREHREATEDCGDLLSMLLAAQDSESEGGNSEMTDEQVRDECLTILLAGHETTANALTWTWYLLSQNPECEARLHAELDQVLGGRPPVAEDFSTLKYTEMVFAEALRMYPPAWTMARLLDDSYSLGGYDIPKGALLLSSQWVVHRNPKYFPEPERFDPQRWTPEARSQRPKFSYFPFGAGDRQCIGEGFAWMEGVLVLATLAQRWRPELIPGQTIALSPAITLRPKFGITMKLNRREY